MDIQAALNKIVLNSTEGEFAFANLKKPVVVYFYPKDNTPGCTDESRQSAELHAQLQAQGYDILGVSRDSMASHLKFRDNFQLPFLLLSDPDEVLCQLFEVIKEKKNFGKTYMGIERSTFVLDKELNVLKEWRKVKVDGHAAAVLAFVSSA